MTRCTICGRVLKCHSIGELLYCESKLNAAETIEQHNARRASIETRLAAKEEG